MMPDNEFLNEEVRCGYTVSHKMKQVWAYQLDLLEKVRCVCDKYNLRFWLDSGTLLGAIRHKGYIPWDDDVDIIMMRDDYDKLVKVSAKEFKSPYIFQTAYNEKHYVRGHAQVRNVNTTALIPWERYKKFNHGIFIDIFVLDYIPEDEKSRRILQEKSGILRLKLEYIATPVRDLNRFKKHRVKLLNFLERLAWPKWRFNMLFRAYENLFRNQKKSSLIAAWEWLNTCKLRPVAAYNDTVYMDFEYVKQLPVPAGYDELLRLFYGDYMKPVQAPNCHGEVMFDVNTPSRTFIKLLKKNKKAKA